RQLVARLERRVELAEEADVLAVHEDVHEAPHLSGLVTDTLLDPRVPPLEIVDQRRDGAALGLDGSGARRVLAEWGGDPDLHHDDVSSSRLPVTPRSRCDRRR